MAWRPNRRLGLCSVPVPLPALCPRPSTSLHASPTKCNLQGVKTKKIMYDAAENDDFDREEIPTYEEVAKLYPRPGLYRPVVLIGPPGVGRNELKRRLMATDPDKYKTPVPCKFPTRFVSFSSFTHVHTTACISVYLHLSIQTERNTVQPKHHYTPSNHKFCFFDRVSSFTFRYLQITETRWNQRQRVSLYQPREDGRGHRGWHVHRIRRVQGQPVRHQLRERQLVDKRRIRVPVEPSLSSTEDASNTADETVRVIHQAAEVRDIERNEKRRQSKVDFRRKQLSGFHGKLIPPRNRAPFFFLKGAGKFDGPKNYEYFGELVKTKVHIRLTRAVVVYFNTLWTIESNIKREEKRALNFSTASLYMTFFYIAYRCAWFQPNRFSCNKKARKVQK